VGSRTVMAGLLVLLAPPAWAQTAPRMVPVLEPGKPMRFEAASPPGAAAAWPATSAEVGPRLALFGMRGEGSSRLRRPGRRGEERMAGCDEFEIAIERWIHGALAPPERPALEAHLAGCERCRAYEAAAREAEAALRAEASAAVADVDWARLDGARRAGVPPAVRTLGAAVIAAGWVAGVVWLSTTPGLRADRMVRALPTVCILVVLVALVAGYSARRLVARVDQGEALEAYRHVVLADLTWARRMQWATAALLAFFLYKALTGSAGPFDPAVYYGGLGLPLAAAWLHLRRVKVPRAEREARDLTPAPGEGRAR